MNDLKILNFCGKKVVDSRDVAKVIGKNHADLMRDIRTYVTYINVSKININDFFISSTYVSSQNKELSCYLITKKGCEFIANKMTGQKGALFTAFYIQAFNNLINTSTNDVLNVLNITSKDVFISCENTPQCLYIIKNSLNNNIKISITQDVNLMLSEFKLGLGLDVILLYTSEFKTNILPYKLLLANKLNDYHVLGDWYKVDDNTILSIVNKLI